MGVRTGPGETDQTATWSFQDPTDETWTLAAYQSWHKRAFGRAAAAAGAAHATPYTLRHSFLLFCSEKAGARQLGHDARLSRYGHVMTGSADGPGPGQKPVIRTM